MHVGPQQAARCRYLHRDKTVQLLPHARRLCKSTCKISVHRVFAQGISTAAWFAPGGDRLHPAEGFLDPLRMRSLTA
jgi:hypothetical protein